MLNQEVLKMDTTLLRPALEIRPVELHTPFSWLRAGLGDLRAAPLLPRTTSPFSASGWASVSSSPPWYF
jgi:hypothetical protein